MIEAPPRALKALLLAALVLVGLDRLLPPDLGRYRDHAVVVEDRAGTPLRLFTARDGMWRLPTEMRDVDPAYLDLLIATEDRHFFTHGGIDGVALGRAVWQRLSTGRIVSGGSTLTMQTARLLMPHRHTLFGKLVDMARAFQLEERYGKDEILAMYLTLAPMGGNIEGVRAASLLYFDRSPHTLSAAQAALLVALPRRPGLLRPDRAPEAAKAARDRILARAVVRHDLSPERAAEALAVAVPAERHALPFLAPHLAARLVRRAPTQETIRTRLDGALQGAIEALVRREAFYSIDGADLAAIVVDNRDASVRAWVGGGHFFERAGQIDLARARRSPGSTLKPFIYGLAFDEPLAVPETLIEDRPMRFEDYAPQNFDRTFHGEVTVREALQQSYNVPAIELLERLGPTRLAATLRQAGAVLAFPDHEAEGGLPLALGGVGIDLADLTMLYAGIADGGTVRRLRVLDGDPAQATGSVMSPAAAWRIGDILRGSPLPDGLALPAAARMSRPIAFKTGTSFGFRDAWAIGFTPTYTVGVWVGRPDGTPRPDAFGRNTAAPLLFKIYDLLPPETVPLPTMPDALASEAGGHAVPAGLRKFARGGQVHARSGNRRPRILYPPDGATIELDPGKAAPPLLDLEAEGGKPPYRWAVNGAPLLQSASGGRAKWRPDGDGFVHLSVVDSEDRAATADIRLR